MAVPKHLSKVDRKTFWKCFCVPETDCLLELDRKAISVWAQYRLVKKVLKICFTVRQTDYYCSSRIVFEDYECASFCKQPQLFSECILMKRVAYFTDSKVFIDSEAKDIKKDDSRHKLGPGVIHLCLPQLTCRLGHIKGVAPPLAGLLFS